MYMVFTNSTRVFTFILFPFHNRQMLPHIVMKLLTKIICEKCIDPAHMGHLFEKFECVYFPKASCIATSVYSLLATQACT